MSAFDCTKQTCPARRSTSALRGEADLVGVRRDVAACRVPYPLIPQIKNLAETDPRLTNSHELAVRRQQLGIMLGMCRCSAMPIVRRVAIAPTHSTFPMA